MTATSPRRLADFHAPYHAALAAEIERVRAMHGVAILYDCHSIRSVVPCLFEGRLPDFNIGTNDGQELRARRSRRRRERSGRRSRLHACRQRPLQGRLDHAPLRPAGQGVHAIQMELTQATHLAGEAPPFAYSAETRPAGCACICGAILAELERIAPGLAASPRTDAHSRRNRRHEQSPPQHPRSPRAARRQSSMRAPG